MRIRLSHAKLGPCRWIRLCKGFPVAYGCTSHLKEEKSRNGLQNKCLFMLARYRCVERPVSKHVLVTCSDLHIEEVRSNNSLQNTCVWVLP